MRWFCALLVIVTGCSRGEPAELRLDDRSPDWSRHGFVEMVPPLRLPTTTAGDDDVRVWLKLPPDGAIAARWLPDQRRFALVYPPGTVAARVESHGGEVADVRGTELGHGGQERFFVYRPAGDGLSGVSWSRGNPSQQAMATERLAATSGEASSTHVRRQNDCAGCHVHSRSPNTVLEAHGLANRGTDAAGFFQVQTILEDEAPLETYKPRDPNVDAAFVVIACGRDLAIVERTLTGARPRCPDGQVPTGRFDVAAALRASDPHALHVCESRRTLARFLDQDARRVFELALRECSIVVSSMEPP